MAVYCGPVSDHMAEEYPLSNNVNMFVDLERVVNEARIDIECLTGIHVPKQFIHDNINLSFWHVVLSYIIENPELPNVQKFVKSKKFTDWMDGLI